MRDTWGATLEGAGVGIAIGVAGGDRYTTVLLGVSTVLVIIGIAIRSGETIVELVDRNESDESDERDWECPSHDEFVSRCDYCSAEARKDQVCEWEGCDEHAGVSLGYSSDEYDHLCYDHYSKVSYDW